MDVNKTQCSANSSTWHHTTRLESHSASVKNQACFENHFFEGIGQLGGNLTHLPSDRNLAQCFCSADRLSSSGLTQPIVLIRLLQDELPVRRKRRLKNNTKCISSPLIRMDSATSFMRYYRSMFKKFQITTSTTYNKKVGVRSPNFNSTDIVQQWSFAARS